MLRPASMAVKIALIGGLFLGATGGVQYADGAPQVESYRQQYPVWHAG